MQCYERRGKEVVGPKETKRWAEVTPSMMSDEEEQGETYIRHPPLYRSTLLSEFIEKLESRYDKRSSIHPRKMRVLGAPVDVPVPAEAKKWMIRPESCRDTAHDVNDQHPIHDQPTSQQEEDTQEASRNSGEESDSSGSVELF